MPLEIEREQSLTGEVPSRELVQGYEAGGLRQL